MLYAFSPVLWAAFAVKIRIMERFSLVSMVVSLKIKGNWRRGDAIWLDVLKSLRLKEDRKKSLNESTIWVFSFMCN